MTASKAVSVFTALESDLAASAVSRNSSLTCEVPIRMDDGSLRIVKIHSTSTGILSYVDGDGVTSLTRLQFVGAYVSLYAERLDAMETAKNHAFFSAENIGSFANAKGEYY